MREKYERIKARAGGKRAIIAIARKLLTRPSPRSNIPSIVATFH